MSVAVANRPHRIGIINTCKQRPTVMTIESKPEHSEDFQEKAATDATPPLANELHPPLILPPPIPGQTAWSILPW
jgi:hypothetical protein